MPWWIFALLSAVFAALTTILAKVGVRGVPSNLATALRTAVVLLFAWGMALGLGEQRAMKEISGRTLWFLTLSGLATGASWLAYFRALQLAPASRVAPIDKLSLAFTVILAVSFLGESVSWKVVLGTFLMVVGALITSL